LTLAENQIKESLINAAGAFEWDVQANVINLIAMDSNNYQDIEICDAVFGTESEMFKGNRYLRSKKEDGFFLMPNFSNKVAGVIALESKERSSVLNLISVIRY